MDRDTKFCESFRSLLSNEDVEPVRLPPRSPNMNAHLERFFGSLKSECLNRLILFGEKALRNAVNQYLEHYHDHIIGAKIYFEDKDLNETGRCLNQTPLAALRDEEGRKYNSPDRAIKLLLKDVRTEQLLLPGNSIQNAAFSERALQVV